MDEESLGMWAKATQTHKYFGGRNARELKPTPTPPPWPLAPWEEDWGMGERVAGLEPGAPSPSLPTSSLPLARPRFDSDSGSAAAGSLNKVASRNPQAGTTQHTSLNVAADKIALAIDVAGQPSLSIFQEEGTRDLVMSLQRRTRWMEFISPGDLNELERVLDSVELTMRRMSRGPFTLELLARMGHPYGFSTGQARATSSRTFSKTRASGQSLRHSASVRGSVPTMSVVNEQSGQLSSSYSHEVIPSTSGVRLEVRNTAKSSRGFSYPFALAGGTGRMAAHGPFSYGFAVWTNTIDAAWSRVTTRAYHRARAAALRDLTIQEADLSNHTPS